MSTHRTHGDSAAGKIRLRGMSLSGVSLSSELAQELQPNILPYPDYKGGLNYQDAQQDLDAMFTQETRDVVITNKGRLKRAPGHLVIEELADSHVVQALLIHPSLDFSVELLIIDGEYVGIKDGTGTTWIDASLPAGDGWVGITNGENILFTNGVNGIYTREYADSTIGLITDSPAGRTLANFAGRVWVGGPTVGGSFQAMGVYWSGASGLITDWLGIGAGAELLISNNLIDDRVQAMRPISFDLLAILCQRTVWVAIRTGDPYRPAEFEIRSQGVGCIAESTVQSTPLGVIFLSDDGVMLFDGNQVVSLSKAIDAVLLPVLTDAIAGYSSAYEAINARYWLFTPTESFCFEVTKGRWLRYRFVTTKGIAFSEQFASVTWESALGLWSSYTDTWADLETPAGTERLVLGYQDKLAVLSNSSDEYIDESEVRAEYEMIRRDGNTISGMFTTDRLFLRRTGAEAELEVHLPGNDGTNALVATRAIPNSSTEDVVELGLLHTGRGAGGMIAWTDVSLEVSHVALRGLLRSKRIGMG